MYCGETRTKPAFVTLHPDDRTGALKEDISGEARTYGNANLECYDSTGQIRRPTVTTPASRLLLLIQWLKYKKFGVRTPIRERLATPIRGVGTLMCRKLEAWERRSRPFPLTFNTVLTSYVESEKRSAFSPSYLCSVNFAILDKSSECYRVYSGCLFCRCNVC